MTQWGMDAGRIDVVAGVNNERGVIVSMMGDLDVHAEKLRNAAGRIHSDNLFIDISNEVDNAAGSLWGMGQARVKAVNILNRGGRLGGDQGLSVDAKTLNNGVKGYISSTFGSLDKPPSINFFR